MGLLPAFVLVAQAFVWANSRYADVTKRALSLLEVSALHHGGYY